MPMPKATINEYCYLVFWKNEIGIPMDFIISAPSYYLILPKE